MRVPVYLTISETARALGRSTDSVRLYERRGRLRALRTSGGVRLFDKRDVDAFARGRVTQKKVKAG